MPRAVGAEPLQRVFGVSTGREVDILGGCQELAGSRDCRGGGHSGAEELGGNHIYRMVLCLWPTSISARSSWLGQASLRAGT